VSSPQLFPRPLAAKVPEITALFWIIKILTTGTGEAASDYFASVNLVLAGGLGALGFAVSMWVQFRTRRYVPAAYWFAVLMVAIFGTMAADALHKIVGIPYVITTAFYAVALAVVFALWRRIEGTLSIHSIRSRRRETWYWLTVLLTFALGTAAGDLTAFVLHLGYFWSGVLFTAAIAVPAVRPAVRHEPGRRVLVGLRADPPAGRVIRRLARQVARPRRPRLGRRRRQRDGDRRHRAARGLRRGDPARRAARGRAHAPHSGAQRGPGRLSRDVTPRPAWPAVSR
jgi:uncharacterized membrane-anchored protein